MTTTSFELFAYPWDILDRGPEAFIDECVGLGIHRVHATTLYHSGKFLLPRNRSTKVYFPEPGHLFVSVPDHEFAGNIRPRTSALANSGWLERLSIAATAAGIRLSAWTVFHHSSALAGEHPQFAIHNLFGDVYPFALCPSNEAVRAFSLSLARAIASLGIFDALDLETIGFLGYSHGHHHEVTGIPAGTLERFLLSLCFCPACRAGAQQEGIPVEELRDYLERVLMAKLSADDSDSRHPDNAEQLLTLIALTEPLQKFIRFRINTVTHLVQSIRRAIPGIKIGLFSSSFVGSPSNIWMEGLSILDLQASADTLHLLAYSDRPEDVNNDLNFCLTQVEDPTFMNLTLNLGIPVTPTLSNAMSKVEYAWKRGVRRFSFFNYGFLGERRLRWIQEIARAVRERDSAAVRSGE